ncbi:MAG: hypothetical protein JXB88_23925 [Spirochaetales bacterium]|nr:hypothetical protein [Spirochaetales bacterium]
MSFFKSRHLPVDDEAGEWVENTGMMIFRLFGLNYLKAKPIIYPDMIFSGMEYKGREADVDFLVFQISHIMDIHAGSIRIEYTSGEAHEKVLNNFSFAPTSFSGTAGTYNEEAEGFQVVYKISLKRTLLKRPAHLIAVIIHELSHLKLEGERRIYETDEELTDLLSVFFGLGIFSANAVMPVTSSDGLSKLGYLTPSLYGYALALWVLYKDADDKKIIPFLTSTVKDVFKKSVRYIRDNDYKYWTSFNDSGNFKRLRIVNPFE